MAEIEVVEYNYWKSLDTSKAIIIFASCIVEILLAAVTPNPIAQAVCIIFAVLFFGWGIKTLYDALPPKWVRDEMKNNMVR